MLEALCGNKNISRILLFLFVNGKCYGTQLHRSLHTALTPLQKALSRLEAGGLITSYYEGKTRVYQFNHTYPLMHELEQLLKKCYTLLPGPEKKRYIALPNDMPSKKEGHKIKTLLHCWEQLAQVTHLSFQAKTKEKQGWDGEGKGDVTVTKIDTTTLLFTERGSWRQKSGGEVNFTNAFRWTLDRHTGVISLEHLRHGEEHPVFIFHLAPTDKNTLSSVDSHLCGGDTYFGHIHFDNHVLSLHWRVIGPKKNEELAYNYH